MKREQAYELLKKYVKSDKMLIHCRSSEVVMRAIALRLGEDVERWGLAGLLHDIDVELTHDDPKQHGLLAVDILKENGFDNEFIEAVRLHNEENNDVGRSTVFHYALSAGETITGLIYAATLVYPDKKIANIKYKSVTKRMKQKAFAASVKRENIMECEHIGIPLAEFVQLSVDAMREISDDIGL